MKTSNLTMFAAVLCLCAAPALAQSSRAGGASVGHAVTHGSINHGGTNSGVAKSGSSHGTGKTTASGQKTVSELLAKNTTIAGKIEKLLGDGTTAQDACSGFKNLGQCVAAAHVSHNMQISFTELKAKMLGDPATNTEPKSLGQAIQDFKPTADAPAEARKATKQAKVDLKGTHS